MRSVLLDTNAFTALFRGNREILRSIAGVERVFASVIAIGELEAGFRGGSRYSENIEILERFLSKPAVRTLSVTRETSEYFGRIKHSLRKNGTPIPLNDVWLAAQCLERGTVLITLDTHFARVSGLRVWNT